MATFPTVSVPDGVCVCVCCAFQMHMSALITGSRGCTPLVGGRFEMEFMWGFVCFPPVRCYVRGVLA